MTPAPKPNRAIWITVVLAILFLVTRNWAKDSDAQSSPRPEPHPTPDLRPLPKAQVAPIIRPRTFRTFLPKPGEAIDDPASQVVQVLLDRQDKGDFESYMVQILFRGKPSARNVRVLEDRIEIDFYDTGKPAMRLSKIRGGAVEASSLEEFFYKDAGAQSGKGSSRIKRLLRLTIFIHEKADLKFRDTLDRTLIHFHLPKAPSAKG